MKRIPLLLVAATLLAASLHAQPVAFREAVSGDLSNDNNVPTFLSFDLGLNTIEGRMGRPGTGAIDRDIFSFTIGENEIISGFDVLAYAPVTSARVGSFLALSAGDTITVANASSHLSNILVTRTGPILDSLSAGAYSDTVGQSTGLGFDEPLGAGTYTVWFQELSSFVDYKLGVTVSAVPEPSTYALTGAGILVGLIVLRRRKRRAS